MWRKGSFPRKDGKVLPNHWDRASFITFFSHRWKSPLKPFRPGIFYHFTLSQMEKSSHKVKDGKVLSTHWDQASFITFLSHFVLKVEKDIFHISLMKRRVCINLIQDLLSSLFLSREQNSACWTFLISLYYSLSVLSSSNSTQLAFLVEYDMKESSEAI